MNLNILKIIVLATLMVATTLGFAQTVVNPDDEVGSPAVSTPSTQSQGTQQNTGTSAQVQAPVDLGPRITELQGQIAALEDKKAQAQTITNTVYRRQTLKVIQDVSDRYKAELAKLKDHVNRVLQPELARVRGYASEGVRLARKHETDLADLDARIKALESSVPSSSAATSSSSSSAAAATGGTASAASPTTTPGVPPVPGTVGVSKVNTNWFETALQGAGQILTILGIVVVIALVFGGLFTLLRHNASLKDATTATKERLDRNKDAAEWGATFTNKPSWADKGKVSFDRTSHADGSRVGTSSGSYSFGEDAAKSATSTRKKSTAKPAAKTP